MRPQQKIFIEALNDALNEHYFGWKNDPEKKLKTHRNTIKRWLDGEGLPTETSFRGFLEDHPPFDKKGELGASLLALYIKAKEEDRIAKKIEKGSDAESEPPKRKRELPFALKTVVFFTPVLALLLILIAIRFVLNSSNRTATNHWPIEEETINGLAMMKVRPDCFIMGYMQGELNEQPTSEVCFEEAFWIGKTEVTIEQYGSKPDEMCNLDQQTKQSLVNGTDPHYPRNCVTWEEANAFCLSLDLRLPTEAEWEYAARGPESWLYSWGNDVDPLFALIRTRSDEPRKMKPVGSMLKDTSWVGAKDMIGSLREFTSTIYSIHGPSHEPFQYPYNRMDGRENLVNVGLMENGDATTRVTRGGSFDHPIGQSRATIRYDEYYDFSFNQYGFRCAVTDSQKPAQ